MSQQSPGDDAPKPRKRRTPRTQPPERYKEMLQRLMDDNPEALLVDGMEAAILGVARRCGQPTLVVYSERKIIDLLKGQGMDEDEAWEFYDFNILGAWVGDNTPLFLSDFRDEQ